MTKGTKVGGDTKDPPTWFLLDHKTEAHKMNRNSLENKIQHKMKLTATMSTCLSCPVSFPL